MLKKYCLILLCLMPMQSYTAYRAYQLEVYDLITNNQFVTNTAFPPVTYQMVYGGKERTSYLIKATWRCYNDTSYYKKICDIPDAKNPLFKIGERVEVTLKKHVTHKWNGVVEVVLWRDDLKSNVYGIRFVDYKNSYTSYYEKDLKRSD